MQLSDILSKDEIIKALAYKRDLLSNELHIIDHSLINDKTMPSMIRELRSIEAEAMEYQIRLLEKRIAELEG